MRCGYYPRVVRLIVVLSIFLFVGYAQAAAVPAYNGRMNNAVAGLVQKKVGAWGFAANDPRYLATTTAIGSGLTSVAVAVGTGAVAAVGWPAVLAGAGITAIAGGVVALVPALVDWLWGDGNDLGDVQLSGSGMGSADSSTLPSMPATYPAVLDTYGVGQNLYFREVNGAVRRIRTISIKCLSATSCSVFSPYNGTSLDYTFTSSFSGPFPGPNGYWSKGYTRTIGSVAGGQYEYHLVYNFVPPAGVPIQVPSYVPAMKPIADAVSDLPVAVLEQPVSDKMLADAVNASWKAAIRDAGGLPWAVSDPITPADVAQWKKDNPTLVPTVGDFLAPVSSGTTVPIGTPSTGPAPSPGTGTDIDLGPDPNTPAPILEPTPTAAEIISPLVGLMPDLKAFSIPAHTSTCPIPSFSAFGRSYMIDSHCALIDNSRSVIEAAMLLVWSIGAIFIVLRA